MSNFVAPMACKLLTLDDYRTKRSTWEQYWAELKIDGMRAIVTRDDSAVHIYSRTGKEYTRHLPELALELKEIMPDHSTWDGELAYYEKEIRVFGVPVPVVSFNKTMRIMGSGEVVARKKHAAMPGSIHFIVFDVIRHEGQDFTNVPYTKRVEEISVPFYSPVNMIDRVTRWYHSPDYLDILKTLVDHRIEGLVLKNTYGLYVPGKRPVNNQYKLKIEKTYDVIVTGFTMANPGKFEGMIGAIKFGAYDSQAKLVDVGQCSGMNDEERAWWTAKMLTAKLYGEVIEIRSNDLVGSGDYGTPRHPQYLRLRNDKQPLDCTMEQFRL